MSAITLGLGAARILSHAHNESKPDRTMGPHAAPRRTYRGGPPLPDSSNQSAVEDFTVRLIDYIPADILLGYTTVLALIPQSKVAATPGRITAAIFLILAPVLVVITTLGGVRSAGVRPKFCALPWFRIIAAPVSFAAWVCALPASPLDPLTSVSWLKALVLVTVSLVISSIAPLFDIQPQA